MKYEWDDVKEAKNIKTHGVDFLEASTVIENPLALTVVNEYPTETRMTTLGHSITNRLLLVVTYETNDDKIRIISAREANKRERRGYEEGL
jgi:uncharacterized DUF497 family protein